MDKEEIDAGGGRGDEGVQASVDGSADAGDATVVLELEAVVRAGKVGEGREPEALVAVGDKIGESGGHGALIARAREGWQVCDRDCGGASARVIAVDRRSNRAMAQTS
jgi:hypothetical protein